MGATSFDEQQQHALAERLLPSEPKESVAVAHSISVLVKSSPASENDLENPTPLCPVLLPKDKDEDARDQSFASTLLGLIWAPFAWMSMMANELDINFVFGVIVVYGTSQGLGGSLHKVALDYYWKDVQFAQPSAVQAYHGIIGIPLDIKPIWGLLTDIVPIAGYYRRPYFILSGGIGVMAYVTFMLGGKVPAALVVTLLVASAASSAIAEVTIDALAAKKSRDRPDLAADIQSLRYMSHSLGRLVGYSLSGFAISAFGAQGSLGLLSVPPMLLIALGCLLQEERLPKYRRQDSQVRKNMLEASYKMWNTIKRPLIWMPTLYMFLSWAVCPDISEGLFYFYTDAFSGLSLSVEFIGLVYALGSMGAFVGVLTYRNFLRQISFRWLLFWVQIIISVFGMLDFALVTQFNLKLGISNPAFALADETFSRATDQLKYTPLFVLCAKLCPLGIEGTFFALLVSIESIGLRFSSWGGSALLALSNVTRDQFQRLWLVVLIRNALRLLPVVMIFLLPRTTPDMTIE
ncbi:hypothetical protein O6H91_Y254200 [Diphasiastrum complanatum]|nr:hypothetical protein O6H91_Y254200 [Diphasiastrum complanatum]KAJ7294484.1 hypothetical protein O6H91_Y254200 [Diphasiastrum complanatum]KAJ7294485.1 hypothetical protein O6H91_Y254200 [Diphasiastrum complanatum]KAJ7294486.1 hypothetical protein O6H91_Y254200 [Diphasiastrum complanatum]